MTYRSKSQLVFLLISIVIIIPIGFYSKFYYGPGRNWVNNSLGGIFYEIFWILIFGLLFPRTKTFLLATAVFILTSLLEILQLWHPPFLEFLRSFFLGRTILGNCFVWSDFIYYLLGCLIGYFWLMAIKKAPKIGA